MMVQHHVKYEEIHGVDEIVMMDKAEHRKLHARMRKEGKCTITVKELNIISTAAYRRTDKGKAMLQKKSRKRGKIISNKQNCIVFYETVGTNARIVERIMISPTSGTVRYNCMFRTQGNHKFKFIDI